MKPEQRRRARRRLDERLATVPAPDRLRPPPSGWIRAIRDALGMSGVQLAKRLGVKPQSVDAIERSEAAGTIRLGTLARAAEALDCTLVYVLVPNRPLDTMVTERAEALARRDLARVHHTMKLEAQETDEAALAEQLEAYIRDSLRDRDLWNDP